MVHSLWKFLTFLEQGKKANKILLVVEGAHSLVLNSSIFYFSDGSVGVSFVGCFAINQISDIFLKFSSVYLVVHVL